MSDLLARLISDGCAPELVSEVAMLLAEKAISERAINDRRAKDNERQARRRSRDVTECHVTERDSDENPSPSLSPQTPQTHPHPCNNKPARVKGHRLPTDWQPSALPNDLGSSVALWPNGALDRELSRFRDWAASATGPNAVKRDWQAAWRNWVRKAEDEGRYGRAADKPQAPPGANPLLKSLMAKQAPPT